MRKDQGNLLFLAAAASFFKNFILFIYFWLCWVFIAVCGLSRVVGRGGPPPAAVPGPSHCGGFSCYGARAPEGVGVSRCGTQA